MVILNIVNKKCNAIIFFEKAVINPYGTKYSRMDQVKLVEDSL